MENSDTELSNKTAAFISWIEFLGLAVFLSSRLIFREVAWVLYLGLGMIVCGYIFRLVADWRAGRKKSFRRRLIFLLIIFIAAAVLGYLSYKRNI